MRGGKQLLLLAVFVLLARCQQKPTVSIIPKFKQIFSGDIFYLSCENSTSGNTVKWFFNNVEEKLQTNKIWKIAVATAKHSGSYQCESNSQRSDNTDSIVVLEYAPSASLIIKTGQPVMRTGGSVVLELNNEDGLQGWNCWVNRGMRTNMILLKLNNNSVSLAFQPNRLNVPETIFWCTDRAQQHRSNQITVRTSEKDLALEMDPLPAVVGESLTLRCHVWGTDQISHTVFYKDDKEINMDNHKPTYKITNVTESEKGRYKCNATYTHVARTRGPPYQAVSDDQDLYVQVPPVKAVLSEKDGMLCSCPRCPIDASYYWYYKTDDGQPWARKSDNQDHIMPDKSGTYACRLVWSNKRSLLSNSHNYNPPQQSSSVFTIGIILVVFGGLVILVLLAVFKHCKKRNTTGAIYEDVQLRSRDKGDDKYEELQKARGALKEGEYDTLHPEAPGSEKKEGEYEPLKKDEMKGEVYHSLGMAGAAGGEGGYEALKKEGMKEGVYHSLGVEGAAGGEGGYEALKKEGMKEGVYHSLGVEGAAGGEGGYEALKKEGMKEGVYHSLGVEGAAGGEGGYEALGKDKDRDYEIVKEKK